MKKLITGIAVLAALLTAAPAHADNGSPLERYTAVVERLGYTVTDETKFVFWTVGLAACVDMLNGIAPSEVINDAVEQGFPADDAKVLIDNAQRILCPRTRNMR